MAKRSLELALKNILPTLPRNCSLQMEYERKPFCLRPERKGFHPWRKILTDLGKSRGDPDWVHSFIPTMEARGSAIGIDFDFDVELGNSIGSLRLLWWVKTEYGFGKQEELVNSTRTRNKKRITYTQLLLAPAFIVRQQYWHRCISNKGCV